MTRARWHETVRATPRAVRGAMTALFSLAFHPPASIRARQARDRIARHLDAYHARLLLPPTVHILQWTVGGVPSDPEVFRTAEARRDAEARRREEQARRALADLVPLWLAGQASWEMSRHPDTFLRRRPGHPGEVATSRGAIVPLAQAVRLFNKWERGILRVGDQAGGFTVTSIQPDAVIIGCHTIRTAEARRFFTTLEEHAS